MTNATKAQIVVTLNSLLLLAMAFGLPLTEKQLVSLGVAANAVLGLWVHLTRKNSALRIPDGGSAAHHPQ